MELGKDELSSVDGGGLLSFLLNTFPVATIMVLMAYYVDKEAVEGIDQGWSENKK